MIEIWRDGSAFDELATWWNRCFGPSTSPFLRTEWFSIWADSFLPPSWKLELVTWTSAGEPSAVLPLASNGLRRVSLSNSHTDVFDVIEAGDPEVLGRVSDWLARQPVTRFYRLDGGSRLIPQSPDPGWLVTQSSEAPFSDLGGGLEGLRQNMGRNLAKNIERLDRRLGDLGEVVYIDNADGVLPDAVKQCMDLEAAGWKGSTGTAMLSRPESRMFYERLVETARHLGWLRISALLVAERLVACQLSLDYEGRRHLLKPAYDEELRSHSPGRILQWKVMQSAVELGLESYEFLGESERWKNEWASGSRTRHTILRFGQRGRGAVMGVPMRLAASFRKPRSARQSGAEGD
jgi:CelD/BcsL family acetyltransferase involved in cellulose biosynthesis